MSRNKSVQFSFEISSVKNQVRNKKMPHRKSSENEEDEPSKMKKFKISSDSKSKKKQSKEKDVLVLINMLDGTVVKFRIQASDTILSN